MPPTRIRSRPTLPREIAPGIYATTNYLIIDAAKREVEAHKAQEGKEEGEAEQQAANASHEARGTQSDPQPLGG